MSTKKGCNAIMLLGPIWYYESIKRSDKAVRGRIKEMANTRIGYGLNRIFILLCRKVGRTIRSVYTVSIKQKD